MKRVALALTGWPDPVRRMVKAAQFAEECGYEMVLSAEDYFTGRDGVTPLACFALSTQRVKLGTSVINPHTRSPGLIAATMATLDDISHGRMVLGLGAGLDWSGMYAAEGEIKHVKSMRETIHLIRSLLANRTTTYRGRTLTIQGEPFWWPDQVIRPVRDTIPIYVGARGPKMECLTAEIGDGLILDIEIPAAVAKKRIENFRARVEGKGRDFNEVDVASLIPVSVSEDNQLDLATRRYVAWAIAGIDGKKEEEERKLIAESSGVDGKEIKRIKDGFTLGGLTEACKHVSEKSASIYAAWGSIEKCVRKLREYNNAGVKLPTICPIGGHPELAIRCGEKYASEAAP